MSFIKRRLKLKFQLGQGAFGNDGFDTIEFEGLRVSAVVTLAGGYTMPTAEVTAYGMPLDIMNKLSILGKPVATARRNIITVSAYTDGGSLVDLFTGIMNEAWIDGRNAPEMAFPVVAQVGMIPALAPAAGASYKGSVDLAAVAQSIAQQMGLAFENNSKLSVVVQNHHLSGTLLTQLHDVAQAGNFNCIIDFGTVAIWPIGGSRGGNTVEMSAATGLIGYPVISDAGVEVMSLFNPLVQVGGQVNVKSLFTRANGTRTISRIVHELETETPGGKWFTSITGRIFDGPVQQP